MEKEQLKKLVSAAIEAGKIAGIVSMCDHLIDQLALLKEKTLASKIDISEEELKEIGEILKENEEAKKDD